MLIKQLSLHHFKNAAEETLTFGDGVNVICGENASGKTNLLEAMFFFAAGKSFRGCKDRELIRFGEEEAKAELRFARGAENAIETKMGVFFRKSQKRQISVEGQPVRKLAEYLGMFRAVIFTPDHLHLVKGAPENRRHFLDLAICQSFPRYAASVHEYGRLLQQKNALLKGENPDRHLLEVYHDRMAISAAVITLNRFRYLENLAREAQAVQKEMSAGRETLELRYLSQIGAKEGQTAEELRDAYRALYEARTDMEIKRGTALFGPQKDDFAVLINKKNARLFSSQGQQRSAVLALKLAEGELSKRLTGEYPVFLLDDILSELDAGRRGYILSHLSGRQVILTGCEPELPEAGVSCKILVEHGEAKTI
ncbi:MAG: DNA replication/repair protein RecF [Oscillospiraceae bacterium]|nr:DNA replication/repair protein RecF [Oscillospiraceae bacterium]